MCLNALFREVEHRSHLKCSFADSEGPFHNPKTVIPGYDLFHWQISVRDIALQTVPEHILFYLVLVDGHGDVPADVEELVVAALVHVLLRKCALGVGLA